MHAKAGTPPEMVKRLNEALVAAIKDPEVNAKLTAMGLQPVANTPKELLAAQQAEYKLWEAPVRKAATRATDA